VLQCLSTPTATTATLAASAVPTAAISATAVTAPTFTSPTNSTPARPAPCAALSSAVWHVHGVPAPRVLRRRGLLRVCCVRGTTSNLLAVVRHNRLRQFRYARGLRRKMH